VVVFRVPGPVAIYVLDDLLALNKDVYANLFGGSSCLLKAIAYAEGIADLGRAIAIARQSSDVRFGVADACTSGSRLTRGGRSQKLHLRWGGLKTPRVHPILPALSVVGALTLPLVPRRSYEIPIPATAGQTLSILTSGRDVHDTILCCSGPTVHRCWGAMSTDSSLPDSNARPRRAAFSESGFTSFESVDILDLVVRR
jgi:hypothetical protein